MIIDFFNFWYFFWILAAVAALFGLYFLLRNRSQRVQKVTLGTILIFALVLHFLKCFFPPYSTDIERLYRDIWFINICGANILLFPFIFFSKSKILKDYMFYIGLLSGVLSLLLPLEPMQKAEQTLETLDIIRFYIHHSVLWIVPLLIVLLGLHKINYRRVLSVAPCLLAVMLFIMLNQILQSELGFVPLRDDNFFAVNYKNTSYIWAPGDDIIGDILSFFCPDVFKTVPVGEFRGQAKYWPWAWLIVPAFVLVTPLAFLISLIFDNSHFVEDVRKIKRRLEGKKQ